MIYLRHWSKPYDAVAIFTDTSRREMRWWLANGIHLVVTTHAVPRDVVMIEVRGQPAGRGMTVLTRIATEYVFWILTCCGRAVVTARAGAKYL